GWVFSPSGRQLATLSEDRTVLIWDLAPIRQAANDPPQKLSEAELGGLWADLAGDDAAKAYQAIGKLARASQQAVPWLGDHVQPVLPADAKRIEGLLRDLDSAHFEVRSKASLGIEKLCESALPALEQVLARQPSPEMRRRVEQLTAKIAAGLSAEQTR